MVINVLITNYSYCGVPDNAINDKLTVIGGEHSPSYGDYGKSLMVLYMDCMENYTLIMENRTFARRANRT